MADKQRNTTEYPVGYRKPPTRTQFRKGHSGNPKGRPKGSPNLARALDAALSEQVMVNEGGQRYAVTKLVATVKQLVNKAAQGDARATQQVINILHVVDETPPELRPASLPLTETDTAVMKHLIERIRRTNQGGTHDPAHS